MKVSDYKNLIDLDDELQSISWKERTKAIRNHYSLQLAEITSFNSQLQEFLSQGDYEKVFTRGFNKNINWEKTFDDISSSILCNEIVLKILRKDKNNLWLVIKYIRKLRNLWWEVYDIIKQSDDWYKIISEHIKSFNPEIFKTIVSDFIEIWAANELLSSYSGQYALKQSKYWNEIALKIINDKNLGIKYIKKNIYYLSNLWIEVYNLLKDSENWDTQIIQENIWSFDSEAQNMFIQENIESIKEIHKLRNIDQNILEKLIYASESAYDCKLEKYIVNNPSQKLNNNIAKAIFDKWYFYIFRDQIEHFQDIDESILFWLIKSWKDFENIYFHLDKFKIQDINALGNELCKAKKTKQLSIILDKLEFISIEMASLLIQNNLWYRVITNSNKINSKDHVWLIKEYIKANQPLYVIKYINKFEWINKMEIKKSLEESGYQALVEEYTYKFTDSDDTNAKENQNIEARSNDMYGFEWLDGYYSEFPKTVNIKKNYTKKHEFWKGETIRQILPDWKILTALECTNWQIERSVIRMWKEENWKMIFEDKTNIETGWNQDAKINKYWNLLTRSLYDWNFGLNRMHTLHPIKNFPNWNSVWWGGIILLKDNSTIRWPYGLMPEADDIQVISENKYIALTNKHKIRIHSLDSKTIEEVWQASEWCFNIQMIPNWSIFTWNSEHEKFPSEINIFRNNWWKWEKEVIWLKNFINWEEYLHIYALPDESVLVADSKKQCIKKLSKREWLWESEDLINVEWGNCGDYIYFFVDPNWRIYVKSKGSISIYEWE